MIKISGSIQRAFIFPADPLITLTYFSEISHVALFMPHISLVHAYGPHQIRVVYETLELGSYTIRIYSDLEGAIDYEAQTLSVYPVIIPDATPTQTGATMRETTAHGLFGIDAQLFDLDDQTRVEATLRLQAELARPRSMNLMPGRVVNRIAQGITEHRIKEMADGFIRASIEAFPDWEANYLSTR